MLEKHKTTREFLHFDLARNGQPYITVPGGAKMPFTLSINKCSGMSYSNNTITITDSSISLIRVYANIGGSSDSKQVWVRIVLNDSDYATAINEGTYVNATVETLIPVKKGDQIYCYPNGNLYAGSGGLQNFMFVERIV